MLRALLTALLGLWLPFAAVAGQVSTFRLDNGLEAVVIEDRRAPIAVHMVWYRVGAADEPAGKSGIAHYLEHLLFKGTETLAPGEFSATVAAEGGRDNAFTSHDYTGYFQSVAADRLETMMRMEADRMRNLRMTEEDARTELRVILEERAQVVESEPGSIFTEQRQAMQFLNHPYGIPVIGWRHEMERLTRQDALDFYRTYYAPNNAVLIVAGDVDPSEVRRLAEKHYGVLAPTSDLPPRMRPQEPPQLAERRFTLRDARVGQPYMIRSYLAPARQTGDQREAAAIEVLAELLGGSGLTSVLGRKLELGAGVAVNTGSFYDAVSLDPSSFGLFVMPAAGVSLADAEAALDLALAEFLAEGVDPEALGRVKTQVRAQVIYDQDSAMGQAMRMGRALTAGLTVADVQEWSGVLQEVTAEEVIAAAQMLLDPRRSVTGYLERAGTPAGMEVVQ